MGTSQLFVHWRHKVLYGDRFYHATKFAVEGLSESLSQKVAPLGIKVLLVEPGPFRTTGRDVPLHVQKLNWTIIKKPLANGWQQAFRAAAKQAGDPVRGCHAIIDAVQSGKPQLRLLLGEMAYNMAIEKLDILKNNFESLKAKQPCNLSCF